MFTAHSQPYCPHLTDQRRYLRSRSIYRPLSHTHLNYTSLHQERIPPSDPTSAPLPDHLGQHHPSRLPIQDLRPITFFDLNIPKDGKEHKLPSLIDHATNGGNPVNVPADFFVDEVLLSLPSQLSAAGGVTVDYPSGVGSHRASEKLNVKTTDVKVNANLKDVVISASK